MISSSDEDVVGVGVVVGVISVVSVVVGGDTWSGGVRSGGGEVWWDSEDVEGYSM